MIRQFLSRLTRRELIVFLTIATCCRQAPLARSQTPVPSAQPDIRAVSAQRRTPVVVAVHNVMPAVVNIQVEAAIRQRQIDPFFGFFGGDRVFTTQSVGSGFIWASDGIVVTNAHVIEGASAISVKLHNGDQLPAKVIGVDPDSDLAVLQVDRKRLPAAPIGTSSDLLIGETVIAVGNPFALSGTVTTGVVSATGRSVPAKEQGRTFTDFIQTDASINPGNSGGPLLNIEGKVIGINTAIYAEAQGIGFAIPVDRARKIVEDLRRFGEVHNVWIGAVTATVTPEEARRLGLSATRGALVTRVFPRSPAAAAGLQPGDVIERVGTSPVDSREAFSTITATATPSSILTLTVRRGREVLTLTLRPTEPPRNEGIRILEQVAGIGVADAGNAVAIDSVRRGSRAEAIGLAPGDVIVAVNGRQVESVRALDQELLNSSDRSSFVLSIARGRFIYTLTFPLG